jgi:hypothetical protein
LLVTVAEAAEWQHETISSLRFGLSCGKISKASVRSQKVQDIGANVERLKADLNKVNQDMASMEAQG